jgi:sensor histidine kinase regulating citrate/malate metabolism
MRISVADNGPGIPELERHVIESGTETPLNHSLGVGFWLMEWVATALGGEFTIADNEPRGSVVTFRLPDAGRSISERERDGNSHVGTAGDEDDS